MKLSTRLKKFLKLGSLQEYKWDHSKKYDVPWLEDMVVFENCKLFAKSKCNVIVSEKVCFSIDNDFEGIVIGKKDSTIRINASFKGLIYCDLLLCSSTASIKADVFVNKLIVKDGMEMEARVQLTDINIAQSIMLSDLNGLTPSGFIDQYNSIYRL